MKLALLILVGMLLWMAATGTSAAPVVSARNTAVQLRYLREFAAIYHSLSWEEVDQKHPLGWFLEETCTRYPKRCALTERLRKESDGAILIDPR